MIVYVTSLVRYETFGWLYKVDFSAKSIIGKVRVKSDNKNAKHGGPHGLVHINHNLVTGTYSNIQMFDLDLNPQFEISDGRLAGVHGISKCDDGFWVSSCNNESVMKFDMEGNVIEVHHLLDNSALRAHFDLEQFQRGSRELSFEDQPFHVNHVQETGGRLLVSLSKEGCIWDLRNDRPVINNAGRNIHDAQLVDDKFYANDTGNQFLRVFNLNGEEQGRVRVQPYFVRSVFQRMRRAVRLEGARSCRVNWLRGLKVLDGQKVLVGSSPATILLIDLALGKVVDRFKLSDVTCEAVFGIESFSTDRAASPSG